MTALYWCTRSASGCATRLSCRSVTRVGGVIMLAVVCACGTKANTEAADAGVDAGAQAPAEAPDAATQPRAKAKSTVLRDRPSNLIYRQATEQARQHLTADNAHLRLDELDELIEHEKENTR